MPFPHTLTRWDAGAIAGWRQEAPHSNDEPLARVVLLGPELATCGATEVIPSWGAETPPGSWVELQLRARFGQRWSKFFRVATWDSAPEASRRGSFPSQHDADGQLATDTLLLAAPADALQARVLLCAAPGAATPGLTSLALCLTSDDPAPWASEPATPPPTASSITLPLHLSQFSYPGEGPNWCSPTAIVMALAYWRQRTGDPRLAPFEAAEAVPAIAAPQIYDPGWHGTGNWAFNTAFAEALGLTAYVTRLHSLAQLARWTSAGVPLIVSIRWEPGELDGANGRSAGHLTMVTGFNGARALMAEPAAHNVASVARSYRTDQLFACWQRASRGVVYVIHPPGWPRPEAGAGDAWA
ncbi:MAG: peptidase C39 family protein [Chloroflexi bacterium OHK40]